MFLFSSRLAKIKTVERFHAVNKKADRWTVYFRTYLEDWMHFQSISRFPETGSISQFDTF